MTIEPEPAVTWVAVDWGTTNLRVWILDQDHRVLKRLDSTAGMGTLSPGQFEPTLVSLLQPFLQQGHTLPVLCCGMAGARQGWSDAGYLETPLVPGSSHQLHSVATRDQRISVSIIPGVCQACPADVMRGEETQIAGLLHHTPDLSGTLCLPGTHTKWVELRHGAIIRFLTCMTGELFSLLSQQSVLRHSMQDDRWSDDAFDQAVAEVLQDPSLLAGKLFGLRAESLVGHTPGSELRARLSGLLVGSELAATRNFWTDSRISIVGDDTVASLYTRSLSTRATHVSQVDGNTMTLAGIVSHYRVLQDS